MNKRVFIKFSIYAIAILSATLINQYIIDYIKQFINVQGYLFVAIDMFIVVTIFAPAFYLVSKYTKKVSVAYFRTTRKITSDFSGVIIGVASALILLFILFSIRRHQLNIIKDIGHLLSSIN